jgi:hypothetical protein
MQERLLPELLLLAEWNQRRGRWQKAAPGVIQRIARLPADGPALWEAMTVIVALLDGNNY